MTEKNIDRKDHLANERTFLAWIRTNLGIMAFGFVIEKFSLFMQQLSAILGKPEFSMTSSIFGISLVAVGSLLCIFAFFRFKNTQKQINTDTYEPSILLYTLLTALVFFVGLFLVIYLITTHK